MGQGTSGPEDILCKNLAMSARVPRSGTAPHLVVVLALDTVIAFELGLAHRFLAASSLDPGWPGRRTGARPTSAPWRRSGCSA